MSTLERESQSNPSRMPGEDGYRYLSAYRGRYSSSTPNWLLVRLVGAGPGMLAWHYRAPDVRRYLKIRSM
jgi:hypothetical protein